MTFLKDNLIPKRIKIAFDFKEILYYGEKDNPYIFGTTPKKGANKAFKWHTCAIVVKGYELQVGPEMVKKSHIIEEIK